MPYGQIKVDEITFTNAGVDQTISVSGVVASISGNITATGTISGNVIRGGTLVSGATVTGTAGQFGTITGNTAGFTTVTGTTVTGTTANFATVSGTTVTGTTAQFTTVTGGTAGFTTITGTTVTGTTVNFVTVSGTTVTGNVGNFTTITGGSAGFTTVTGTTITGTTLTVASGTFTGNSTAAAFIPTGSTVPTNGVYLPSANNVAIGTNGTGRLFVNSSGSVGIGTSSPSTVLHCSSTDAVLTLQGTRGTGASATIGTGGANSQNLVITAGTDLYQRGATHLFQNVAGTTEYARITSAGLVGIGTSSIRGTSLLDARGDISFGSNANYYGLLSYNAGTGHIETTSSDGGFKWIRASGPATSMTLDSSGRLGIGTSTPGSYAQLAVFGTANVATYGNVSAIFSDGTTGSARFHHSSGNVKLSSDSALAIGTGASATEVARFDTSGRLLVGTSTSNGGQLEVNRASNNSSLAGVLGFPQFSITNSFGYGYPAGMLFKAPLEPSGPIVNNAAIWSEWTSNNNAYLGFATNNGGTVTEGMRIDSSSRLLVGKTSPVDTNARISVRNTTAGGIAIESDNSGTFGIRIYNATTGAGQTSVGFLTTGGASMGAITNNNSTVTYSSASDYRLKENVSTIADAISRLQQLKPSRFNFISTPGATVDGFIAHEVQEVVPEAITGEKDAVDEDGNPIYQGIDQSKLVPLLTAALQEAIAKIETLEARLTAAGIA